MTQQKMSATDRAHLEEMNAQAKESWRIQAEALKHGLTAVEHAKLISASTEERMKALVAEDQEHKNLTEEQQRSIEKQLADAEHLAEMNKKAAESDRIIERNKKAQELANGQ